MPRITVLGSINMDLVVLCQALPSPGETVIADSSREICGGKGANQAVSAARAGGEVTMIGRVGNDGFADRLVTGLQDEGIDCSHVQTTDCASGVAVVAVEQSGQNSIMVVPGANGRVSPADVHAAREVIQSSDMLLVQLEIPLDTVLAAIDLARTANVRTILDPAPAPSEWSPELLKVDLLCPNESEARSLCGDSGQEPFSELAAARMLHERGARNVALTLGDRGTLLWDGDSATHCEPTKIDPVDTTAAGDAFAGALAVHWAEHNDLPSAIAFANAAGALAASRLGAQPGMGTREEIQKLVDGANY